MREKKQCIDKFFNFVDFNLNIIELPEKVNSRLEKDFFFDVVSKDSFTSYYDKQEILEGYLFFIEYVTNNAYRLLIDSELLIKLDTVKKMAKGESGYLPGEPLFIELYNFIKKGGVK